MQDRRYARVNNFEEEYAKRKAQADNRAAKLVSALMKAGRQEELFRASESAEYREMLYKEFHIDG